uniref:Single-stranded DNA-binding protein n=1 Tax=Panagrellus redivivus TaxID=6233 RepID=A0A7E4ZYJ1_PANRE
MLRTCAYLASFSTRAVAQRSLATSAARFENTSPKQNEVDHLFNADSQQPKRRNAYSLNRVELVGGVAENPVSRVSRNGSEYITFGLFTNVDYRKNDGSFGEHVELHSIHVFGGLAKFVQHNVTRGSRVFVSGRLHYEGGQPRPDGSRAPRVASITADNLLPISRRVQHDNNNEN